MPGITFYYPSSPQPNTFKQTIFFNRLPAIFRTARMKPAICPEARRNKLLIKFNEKNGCPFNHRSKSAFLRSLFIVSSISQKLFVSNPGRATRIKSFPFFISRNFCATTSLSRLLILLRTVAFFETFRETIMPQRLSSRPLETYFKNKKPSLNPFPFLKTIPKSFFPLRRFLFFNMARPSASNVFSLSFWTGPFSLPWLGFAF